MPTWLLPLIEALVYALGSAAGVHLAGADVQTALVSGALAGLGKIAPNQVLPKK